jgi:hypothetical protein
VQDFRRARCVWNRPWALVDASCPHAGSANECTPWYNMRVQGGEPTLLPCACCNLQCSLQATIRACSHSMLLD